MKELLPAGSVVLLKNATKKLMIIGILQMIPGENENRLYDYLAVPFPEGFMGADANFLFNHEDINDVIFTGYDNPERTEFVKAISAVFEHGTDSFS
ncbi:MAG: DUF4176 domain-containing protein [Eubacteriales bacterium]|nr:DUF4176 domain-containing protein [Eubacteriales bacterium]